jgi:peptidyl-prolyl cis-trans isomerase B (cyclophilin B)
MKFYYKLNLLILLLFCGELFSQSSFTGKPRYEIVTKRNGLLLGTFQIELFPNIAPYHAKNFDSLVSQKFYDTTAFHRVVPGFVIQGGDPNSRSGPVSTWGFGDPGQPTVKAEFSTAKHIRGILSAARKANDIHSATSQFFICVAAAPNLDGNYSVYGKVTSGMTVVDTIVLQPVVQSTQRPVQKIEMFVSYIGSNDTVPVAPIPNSPTFGATGLDTVLYTQLKWGSVKDGIIYGIEVSRDSLFNSTDTVFSVASTAAYIKNLKGYSTYYWRVKTNNGGHFSPWSQTWKFTTAPEIIDETGLVTISPEHKIKIFPNPSTDKFYFENLNSADKIEIFDVSGKKILNAVALETSLEIDLSKQAKGIYTYRIVRRQNQLQQGKLFVN